MKAILAGAALVTAIALGATGASAAPLSGFGKAAAADAGIIKVHGMHRECVEGRMGWHRSTPWGGRVACSPPWRKFDRHGRGHGHGHGNHHGYDKHAQPRYVDKPAPRVEVRPDPRIDVRPSPRRHTY